MVLNLPLNALLLALLVPKKYQVFTSLPHLILPLIQTSGFPSPVSPIGVISRTL
jgi:hypothetical protein